MQMTKTKSLLLAAAACVCFGWVAPVAPAQQPLQSSAETALEIPYIIAAMGYDPAYDNFQANGAAILATLSADSGPAWFARSPKQINESLQFLHYLRKRGVADTTIKALTMDGLRSAAISKVLERVPGLTLAQFQASDDYDILRYDGGIVSRPLEFSDYNLGMILGKEPNQKTPADYCVTDINISGSNSFDTRPVYTKGIKDLAGNVVQHELNFWDTSCGVNQQNSSCMTGYMFMSVRLGRIETGECLSAVTVNYGAGAGPPSVPQVDEGQMPFEMVAAWVSPHAWAPPNVTGNKWVMVSKQKMGALNQNIITGVSLFRQIACQGNTGNQVPLLGLSSIVTDQCVVAWKGEGGGAGNSYYDFRVHTTPLKAIRRYVSTADNRVVEKVSGRWSRVVGVTGGGTASYTVTWGVEKGREVREERKLSHQLTAGITLMVETGVPGTTKTGATANLSYTFTKEDTTSVADSFKRTASETFTLTCPAGATLYQWSTTASFDNGTDLIAKSKFFTCSPTGPSATNATNIYWNETPPG